MFGISVLRGAGSRIRDVALHVGILGKTARETFGRLLLCRDFYVTENLVCKRTEMAGRIEMLALVKRRRREKMLFGRLGHRYR